MDDLSQGSGPMEKELQEFLAQEQQKLQFQAQAHRMTEMCWDKCMGDKMGSKLDGKTETCITNCVERFIDTSVAVAQRFQSLLQKQLDQ